MKPLFVHPLSTLFEARLWTTALTNPFVITEDSTYELKMRTQDAVSMDFSGGDNNEFMKTGADPIQLYLTVN